MKQQLIRDPDVVRIELVEELPDACGGGVAMPDSDGIIWCLIKTPPEGVKIPGDVDLLDWSDLAYDLFERGEPITCADQARRFGVPVEVAHVAFWEGVCEWRASQAPAS